MRILLTGGFGSIGQAIPLVVTSSVSVMGPT